MREMTAIGVGGIGVTVGGIGVGVGVGVAGRLHSTIIRDTTQCPSVEVTSHVSQRPSLPERGLVCDEAGLLLIMQIAVACEHLCGNYHSNFACFIDSIGMYIQAVIFPFNKTRPMKPSSSLSYPSSEGS